MLVWLGVLEVVVSDETVEGCKVVGLHQGKPPLPNWYKVGGLT
jgi:hypothetical protein